jgi:hypothetical protein
MKGEGKETKLWEIWRSRNLAFKNSLFLGLVLGYVFKRSKDSKTNAEQFNRGRACYITTSGATWNINFSGFHLYYLTNDSAICSGTSERNIPFMQPTETKRDETTKLFSNGDSEMISTEEQLSKEQEEDDTYVFATSIIAPVRKLPINR